jgi:hypothetical protein
MDLGKKLYYLTRGSLEKSTEIFFEVFMNNNYLFWNADNLFKVPLFHTMGSFLIRFDNADKIGSYKLDLGFGFLGTRNAVNETTEFTPNQDISNLRMKTIHQPEYVFRDIFDDLIVFNVALRNLVRVHLGWIINQTIKSGEDTFYDTPDDQIMISYQRSFFAIEAFEHIFYQQIFNFENNQIESASLKFELNTHLYQRSFVYNRYYLPDIYLGYNIQREESTIAHYFFAQIYYNFYHFFTVEALLENQLYGRMPSEKDYLSLKQFYIEARIRPHFKQWLKLLESPVNFYDAFGYPKVHSYYLHLGSSIFVDDRLMRYGNNNPLSMGFMAGASLKFYVYDRIAGEIKFKTTYNYSPELSRYLENYGQWLFTLYLNFGL